MCRGRHRIENRIGEVQAQGGRGGGRVRAGRGWGTAVQTFSFTLGGRACKACVAISYIVTLSRSALRNKLNGDICANYVQFTLLGVYVLFYGARIGARLND